MPGYSLSLYGFDPLLESGDISKKAAIRFARSVGFQGIEMVDLYWDAETGREPQAETLRKDATAEETAISCYTVHNDLALFDEGPWRALVDRMLGDVDLALRLGAPVMRVEAASYPKPPHASRTFEDCLGPVSRGLKLVARRAASAGINVALENHGRFAGCAERVEKVIEAVDEPNFGSCLDIGNFLCVDEDPVVSVERLARHAFHVHVKDMHRFETDPGGPSFQTTAGRFLRGAVLCEGIVDVAKCLDIVLKASYRGWLSLEFEGPENLFFGIVRGYENLVATMKRLPLRG